MKKLIMVLLVLFVVQGVFGQWSVEESEDLMSGTTDVFLMNIADQAQGTLSTPVLVIRNDRDGDYEVFIHWGGYNLDGDNGVIIGIIGEVGPDVKPEEFEIILSTDREASFIVDSSDFVNKMLSENRFVVSTYSASGRRMIGAWDISGLKDVIDSLK
jgi:hypothetical protein